VLQFCGLEEAGKILMRTGMNRLQLSAKAYHRVLKLARTIADLAGSESVQSNRLSKALQFRSCLNMQKVCHERQRKPFHIEST
jgi:magnesium chelatase family protein